MVTPRRILALALATVSLILFNGCASQPPKLAALPEHQDVSGVHAFLRQQGATDARFQAVTDRPYLQVDLQLRYKMNDYPQQADASERRAFIEAFLERAAAVSESAVAETIDWVDPQLITEFNERHGIEQTADDPKENLKYAYRTNTQQRLTDELAIVAALDGVSELDRYWSAIKDNTEESIMTRGRLTRQILTAPAVPFIRGWIAYHNNHDYRGPMTADFAAQRLYSPADEPVLNPSLVNNVDAPDWALLQRYAPMIVHEVAAHPTYPEPYDHFGRVALEGDELATARPTVDPQQPAIYAYVDRKTIQGVRVRQLNYVIWYPQHPSLRRFDAEAGPLDGWTIRIDLDVDDRPQVIESVSNCGCYYKIFPSEELEAASRERYVTKIKEKSLFIEGHLDDGVDAIVPETFSIDPDEERLVLYFSAGHHQLVTLRGSSSLERVEPEQSSAYTLLPYEELEHLAFGDHTASMFASDGLVRHAHRAECSLLTPSGVYHAGHPRQRETQMVYFDEADFDDPDILQHYLRLPPQAFGSRLERSVVTHD